MCPRDILLAAGYYKTDKNINCAFFQIQSVILRLEITSWASIKAW